MYVCICNSITDSDIRASVAQGNDTYELIKEKLGIASCCGRCQMHARDVIQEACTKDCANCPNNRN